VDENPKIYARSSPELWEALKPLARQMRQSPTEAENALWQRLRDKGIGAKFRRQHTIDRFVVDFYCAKSKLLIEVDGEIHDYTKEEDAIRQQFLEEVHSLRMIRFTNEEVLNNIEFVLETIKEAL
jgi:very-short-patch-repair endonuclease